MDIDEALQKHAEWLSLFRAALAVRGTVDVGAIGADDACRLGEWLHQAARAAKGRLPSLDECIARHAEFHREAGKIAGLINAQLHAEAEAMLGDHSRYSVASAALTAALRRLKAEAQG